jgi:WhiB family redox-sensing transcriptional regulator
VSDAIRLLHLPADRSGPGSVESTETTRGDEACDSSAARVTVDAIWPAHEVPAWQRSANCLGVDPDLFFPERGGSTREAKEVCRGCVVRQECLQYALDNSEKFGIWGGLSERERRRLRRRRDGTPYQISRAC